MLRYWGNVVNKPEQGFRYAPAETLQCLESLLHEKIDESGWQELGDWWNGAFHLQFEHWYTNRSAIHHHYKQGDVCGRGWSGVVYLSPDAPTDAGTSIWREKSTGLCIAQQGAKFDNNQDQFERLLTIENRFNRLVLFRENVLHRIEHGFGTTPQNARLVQTFFFHSKKPKDA